MRKYTEEEMIQAVAFACKKQKEADHIAAGYLIDNPEPGAVECFISDLGSEYTQANSLTIEKINHHLKYLKDNPGQYKPKLGSFTVGLINQYEDHEGYRRFINGD